MKLDGLVEKRKPELYEGDLDEKRLAHYLEQPLIAVDSETRGLNIRRDRLCLVQLCCPEGVVSFVRFRAREAPCLKRLLEAKSPLKVLHFARFDVAVLKYYLSIEVDPIWCTKVASKLVRTYTDRHGLKDLSREMLGVEMDKSDQTSDWAREDLSDSQLEYAANDVRLLIPIYQRMRALLEREGRLNLAERLFSFLPTVAELDLSGFKDIYEH